MNKIEVGEYVRIAGGIIAKVTNKNNDGILIDKVIGEPIKQNTGTIRDWCIFNDEIRLIVKHRKNIIDLIEEGDYVNGCKVYADDLFGKYIIIWEEDSNYYRKIYLTSIDIKTIATKEQFSNIEYKVVE